MSGNPLFDIPTVEDMRDRIDTTRERMETDEEFLADVIGEKKSGNPISLGRRIPDPQEMTDLQVKGCEDNKAKWLKRTTNPKKNFKEEALRPTAVERYKDSMRRVIETNAHAGGMALVNESETMAIIEAVGAEGYAKGVRARKAKILRVHKELDSDRLALASEIDGMGKATDEEREAKMIANKRGLQAIGQKRRAVS